MTDRLSNIKKIIKRNGHTVSFDRHRIERAIEKAFLSVNQSSSEISRITDDVIEFVASTLLQNEPANVEVIQDTVEQILMKEGYLKVAKNYILYREQHAMLRQEKIQNLLNEHALKIKNPDGNLEVFDPQKISDLLMILSHDLKKVSVTQLIQSITPQIYDLIPRHEVGLIVLGSVREKIETHFEYSKLASRLTLNGLYRTSLNAGFGTSQLSTAYRDRFSAYIKQGIDLEMLNPELVNFDLTALASAIKPERDDAFYYLGIQILSDRYLLRDRSDTQPIFELPQWFWMRVAMGLSLKEADKTARAIDFYNTLSALDLVSSTPTLFNSGTLHSQMSSCYLNTVPDSLDGIFKNFSDNAKLSKWAGGIGTDWTPIRGTGSRIHGTNGKSQGVIPFIKIFNDVALAVNQGGKRKGAMCAYMELWHADFEQFLELRKNTGDERRRAHDINTACWIPDLFMKRLASHGTWTFFCPSETPDLHDLYGKAFETRYAYYEKQNLKNARTVQAQDLWRKLLTMLYETGHPWLTFKDACNVRNPQDHVGVIHSSNLCTEITLNTSPTETAVCNLASVNLAHMIEDGRIDQEKLAKTIRTGIRMLDNVIDNNFYPIPEAEKANLEHRAIGLGLMGYQDALFKLGIPFDSQKNITFADHSMEMISYYAILASSELAKERGAYPSYKGSKWDRNLLPIDTFKSQETERGMTISIDKSEQLDWGPVREHIATHGMRNSNIMAIAPTATIANISGIYPCTEPVFRNIYMKENLSGNFIVVNRYLVSTLEAHGLWNSEMLKKIKFYNGSIQEIDEIPTEIRHLFKETFELESDWIVRSAAHRFKWLDQSASTNIFMKTKSGKAISDIYKLAWELGLKTTYYFRSLGATQATKMTEPTPSQIQNTEVAQCAIDDPDCEACQ